MSNRVREVVSRGAKCSAKWCKQCSASSRLTTPPTPGKSRDSPASTDEILLQVLSNLQRNSEKFARGDSPKPDDLEAYRPLDPSRGEFPINDDDIFTAGEGQAPFRGRKRQEDSCALGWKHWKALPTKSTNKRVPTTNTNKRVYQQKVVIQQSRAGSTQWQRDKEG